VTTYSVKAKKVYLQMERKTGGKAMYAYSIAKAYRFLTK